MKVEDVIKASRIVSDHPTRPRSLKLNPPVNLVHKKTGIKVRVDAIDVRGLSPHTVHVMGHDLWLNVNDYELDDSPTPSSPPKVA